MLLTVFVSKQIEGGVYLPACLCGRIVDDFIAVHINLERAFAVGEYDAIPEITPNAAHVATHCACTNLTFCNEEVGIVAVAQVCLEQTVVAVGIEHLQVNHEGEVRGGCCAFCTRNFQARGSRHQDGFAAIEALSLHNAGFADCSISNARTAYQGRA